MNQQVVDYRTGATDKDLTASDHGIVIEKPGQLGADGVHLSEKGKSIFSMGFKPGNLNPSHSRKCGASAHKR